MVVISSFLLGFGGFLEVEWTWRHIAMVGLSCVVGFWDQNTPLWEERANFRQKTFTPVFRHATSFSHNLPIFMSCLQKWHMKTMETETTWMKICLRCAWSTKEWQFHMPGVDLRPDDGPVKNFSPAKPTFFPKPKTLWGFTFARWCLQRLLQS